MSEVVGEKQGKEEHRGSEEIFRNLFESLSDAVFIMDEYGEFIDVNKTACERLGYEKDEMLSMNILKLSPREFAVKIPECLKAVQDCGEAVYEMAIVKKDGSVLPVEANCRVIDFGGEKIMLSVMRDITERKQAEESLRKNENFISSILEGIGDGVVVIDRDYKIISANRGYLEQTKSRRDDIIGKYCYKVSHHIDVPCFEAGEECSVKNAFETGSSHRIIHKHFDKDGNPIFVETISYPLKGSSGSGEVISVVEVVSDVTDRVKSDEELKIKIKEHEEFYKMSIDRELKMMELKNEISRIKDEIDKSSN
jgi:PAS domain S-box-containing protein